ncbi:MAG: transposase [Chloroflexi bacterium]|nr:transposase [Chloroflexota bacterium]
MIWFILGHIFSSLLSIFNLTRLSNPEKDLEILMLRHQLAILQRKLNHPVKPTRIEKLTLAVLAVKLKQLSRRSTNKLRNTVLIFQPETLFRWHRDLVRRKWTYSNKPSRGRPSSSINTKHLILRLAQENPRWGYGKIQGELIKLYITVSQSTIRHILRQLGLLPASVRNGSIGWKHLISHYKDQILACDFFTVETIRLKTIYVLFFIELGTRRVHFAGITVNPNQVWVTQQARHLIWKLREQDASLRFLIHDNDTKFSKSFDIVFQSEGFHVIHTPFQAPNANAFAERWVRSVREECLDHILILNTFHLKRVLLEYVDDYYNIARPHQGIGQRFPIHISVHKITGPIQRRKILGGIINDYFRAPDDLVLSNL